MNLDEMTIGDLKQIQLLLSGNQPKNIASEFIGKYCIARCYAAGVHAGEVVSVDGENVVLKNSIRLWSWKAKDGIALSGVAQHGIDKEESKIDSMNPLIYLTGVCELIPCSKNLQEAKNA